MKADRVVEHEAYEEELKEWEESYATLLNLRSTIAKMVIVCDLNACDIIKTAKFTDPVAIEEYLTEYNFDSVEHIMLGGHIDDIIFVLNYIDSFHELKTFFRWLLDERKDQLRNQEAT